MKADTWRHAILPVSSTIGDAIVSLNKSSMRIVLITDSNLKLIGTTTDGDIRRGLLRGLKLTNPVSEVMNQKPITVPETLSKADVLQIMSKNKLYQIPITDKNFNLIGLHVWDEEITQNTRSNLMVIMAGGKGTRLLPKTKSTPKPMLRIAGKPILEHIINRATEEGFTEIILAIHHLGEMIQEYFGDGKEIGVNISYVKEKFPLGTAGALSLINPKPLKPILVTNGDVITDIKYGSILDFHMNTNSKATMAVQVHKVQIPYGVIQTNGLFISGYEEKPTKNYLINAGIYVIDPDCLSLLPTDKEVQMPDFFKAINAEGLNTVAFMMHENWADIGGHEEFAKARDFLENPKE